MERFPLRDREPNLDLVKPGCSRRREVETHVPMSFEPLIILGLVSVEIVEDDMDGRGWVSRDDLVHEIEELDALPALLVHGRDFAGGLSAWI